jgi:DNA-binding transcriptional ArsR family regulator
MTDRDERLQSLFSALADPTRRDVIRRLSREGPASASHLSRQVPVTRQAVAKHLRALADAGLVTAERKGRENMFRLSPEPLAEAMSWMAAAGAEWDRRLQTLRERLETRPEIP